jgi:alkaline phosphatase D
MEKESPGCVSVATQNQISALGTRRSSPIVLYATVPLPSSDAATTTAVDDNDNENTYIYTNNDNSIRSTRFLIQLLSAIAFALGICVLVLSRYVYRDQTASSSFAPITSSTQKDSDNRGTDNDDLLFQPEGSSSSSLLFPNAPVWRELPLNDAVLTKLAFGSCSSQHMPFSYWDTVMKYNPDLLLLMGDNVYGDCLLNVTTNTTTNIATSDLSVACAPLVQAYRDFANHASVRGAAGHIPVFATLDDHDYGQSDADHSNAFKYYARHLFAEFFQIKKELLPEDGVYRSRVWGVEPNRLQVIQMDTRFGKSPFVQTGNRTAPYRPYGKDDDGDGKYQMLSAAQWQWLTEQLENVPADLRVIVSSIQVLNDATGFECWRLMPSERERLYNLIRTKSVIFLSGDRHVGAFYRDGALVEITASSWTHTQPLGAFDSGCSSATECDEPDPRRDGDFVRVNHFGTLEIDWYGRNVTVALRRAESSYAAAYLHPGYYSSKRSDAGDIIMERSWNFPF